MIAQLSHVSLLYGDRRALDDVSIDIQANERLCIVGANGSGKSTLALVIAGLLAPDAGTVYLAGEKVMDAHAARKAVDFEAYQRARQHVGVVFQNPDDQLVTNVVENEIAFGPENLCLDPLLITSRVDRELARVALEQKRKADPHRLSNGQKQRVAIAAALAMEGSLLVLDEPSSLLDVRGREAILRVMARLTNAGMSIVHVTHFIEDALAADRVVVLSEGRIAAEGIPQELFATYRGRMNLLGLEEPFAARVSERLIHAGINIAWTPDEEVLADEICRYKPASTELRYEPPLHQNKKDDSLSRAISARNLSFAFGKHTATLDKVSLDIARGQRCAVIGQTGSGKSTLLKCLTGLLIPDEGSIEICGIPLCGKKIYRKHIKRAQKLLGYVMQRPERQLFAQSVEEDVAFGPAHMGLSTDEIHTRIDRALCLCGLENRRGDSPFSLSGGTRRLCAIAGILAMEPEILLLDEATSGLDAKARRQLRDLLQRLHKQGVTIVEITHSMEEAALADTVFVLDGGKLVMQGPPQEVFAQEHERFLKNLGLGLPHWISFMQKLVSCGVNAYGMPESEEALAKALIYSLSAH